MANKFTIGIDPDVYRSGVATVKNGEVTLENLTFFQLFEKLSFYREREVKPTVYVECGFLNKSNWHTVGNGTSAVNAKIGQFTGANHEVAKKIVEMCVFLNLPHVAVRPTSSKMTADFFKKLTGIKQRTNQEQRDAYMLVHGR